jgi:hypothetical protein
MISLRVIVGLSICFFAAGCGSERRHRIVVYDEPWSIAAGKRNIICAPELRASCDREAIGGTANLSDTLSSSFMMTPECATVQLVVLAGDDKGSQDLQTQLSTDHWKFGDGYKYWRLRVDYHPELSQQPFYLGPGLENAIAEGDDAEHEVAFICEAAKQNGANEYW